jgi:hypothetical protein
LNFLEAYKLAGGNATQAARIMGVPRSTFREALAKEQAAFKPIGKASTRSLPKKGEKKYYLFSSIQNNTPIHTAGWENLQAYARFLTAEIILGTFTYKTDYNDVKKGKEKISEAITYDERAATFIKDSSIRVANGLFWCGEQNIIPTAKRPTSGFENYNLSSSNIIPHVKFELASVPAMAQGSTKLNYTTGTLTPPNYIAKKAGLLAEQSHNLGFVIVEVNHKGNWWCRHVAIQKDGSFYDLDIHVKDGLVYESKKAASIYWFDLHAAEMDDKIKELCWGEGGVMDALKPEYQFVGDVLSMCSKNHHDRKNFRASYQKHLDKKDIVKEELTQTVETLNYITRPYTTTVVVPSNHDDHFDRWILENDFRDDFTNAEFLTQMQHEYVKGIKKDKNFKIMKTAMQACGLDPKIEFPDINSSYMVAGVENIIHGHIGVNGSRGQTKVLTKLSVPLNKGHSHTVEVMDNVYSAGACRLNFSYMKGPHSHSIGFIVTYPNGARTTIIVFDNKWRA